MSGPGGAGGGSGFSTAFGPNSKGTLGPQGNETHTSFSNNLGRSFRNNPVLSTIAPVATVLTAFANSIPGTPTPSSSEPGESGPGFNVPITRPRTTEVKTAQATSLTPRGKPKVRVPAPTSPASPTLLGSTGGRTKKSLLGQ